MSLAGISDPSNINNLDIYCEQLTCDTLNALTLSVDDVSTVGLVIRAPPVINNSDNNFLVRNATTGSVELNTSGVPGGINGAINVGTGAPVYHGQSGSILQFNNLLANGAQGFSITPAPPLTGGDITINNNFLNQDVRTSAAPSFLGPLHLGGLTQDGAITLSTTALSTSTVRCGAVSQIPMEVVPSSGHVVSLDDPPANDNFTLNNLAQTLTNKTMTNPIIGTILNPNNANQDVSLSATSGGDEFITTFATQDLINKNINAELGGGFYSNTGANRFLRFNISGALNNTATTLRFNQTANRNITFPDLTGTVALTSQIPTSANYVDLTTNQTIGGVKTFTLSPVFNGPTNQTFPTYIPVGIHNTNKDLQAITNMASIDTAQTFLNKTISTLTAIGTTQSLLSGKTVKNYVTGITTVGNVTVQFATIPVALNTNLMTTINILATCTAGPDLNKSKFFSATFAAKNVGGVLTAYSVVNNSAADATFVITLNPALSPGNLLINVNGLTGDTINYSGTYEVIYQ
jgi:hypothetical protein